jgi:hypothetical protein
MSVRIGHLDIYTGKLIFENFYKICREIQFSLKSVKNSESMSTKFINCVTLHLAGYILEYSYDARIHGR